MDVEVRNTLTNSVVAFEGVQDMGSLLQLVHTKFGPGGVKQPPPPIGTGATVAAGAQLVPGQVLEWCPAAAGGPAGVAAAAGGAGAEGNAGAVAGTAGGAGAAEADRHLVQLITHAMKQELRPLKRLVGLLAYGPKSPTSSSNELEVRQKAVEFYGSPQPDPQKVPAVEKLLRCSVSGIDLPDKDVVAGHIFQQRWLRDALADMNIDIDDPLNILLVHKRIMSKYDSFAVTVMPNFKFKVLNPNLLLKDRTCAFEITRDGEQVPVTWKDLDSRDLQSCSGSLPSPQILSVHAHAAVRFARSVGWVKGKLEIPAAPSADSQILHNYLVSQSQTVSPAKGQVATPAVPADCGSDPLEGEGGNDTGSICSGGGNVEERDDYGGSVSGSGGEG